MPSSLPLSSLLGDVDLLCLDAGNTVVFLDHARLATVCARLGHPVSAAEIERAEGRAKLALEQGAAHGAPWWRAHVAASRSWAAYLATILRFAGLEEARLPDALDAMWAEHEALNLWSRVPAGLVDALGRARAAGVQVAVVSNSEGGLDALLARLGVRPVVDVVVDSGVVGVEKPDPRIFRVALEACGVAADRALHLGDLHATDVVGARAAGVRAALVDPYGHLAGRHPDVPRVAGAREVAEALVAARDAGRSGRSPPV